MVDMGNFDRLKSHMDRGKNEEVIPMGFERLTDHVGIYRGTYYLIGGYSGSGKSGLVCDAFILNPYDWYLKNKDTTKIKLKIFFFSMERSISFTLAKWVSRKIFLEQGELISVNRILGRVSLEKKLKPHEEDMVLFYKDYINGMSDEGVLEIIEGPKNPMGIKKLIDDYALSHGHKEKIDTYNSVYIPDNSNEIVLIIKDHIGLYKRETREGMRYDTKKEIIDLASSDDRRFRDLYGYSPVEVSQFNRSIANPIRIKSGNVSPSLEDFKETGSTQEDADVVMALFDPIRYSIAYPDGKDEMGYELKKLRDEKGIKKYRSLSILKNTYGGDDIGIGMAFQPVCGVFKEMPHISKMTDDLYEMIKTDSYFLMDNNKF